MAKIFISHSWNDNAFSRKIAEALKRDGAEVWIDFSKIMGGQALPDQIGEALDWCDTLVLVWSKSAAESYYVKLEWQSVLDLQKKIIPCIIDDAKRPVILRSFRYVDFKNFDSGYKELLDALDLEQNEPEPPQSIIKQPTAPEPSRKTEKVKESGKSPIRLKIASIIIPLLLIVTIGAYLIINYKSKDHEKVRTTIQTTSREDSLKTYWEIEQKKMSESFAVAQNQDKSTQSAPIVKLKTWQEFLNNYASDNPLSQQDDSLRAIAKTRMNLVQGKISVQDSLKTARQTWTNKQLQMNTGYQDLLRQDSDTSLSPIAKTKLWQDFLKDYQEDNPFSQDDDRLRNLAREKMNYWRNYKPTPKITPAEKITTEIEYVFIPGGSFAMGDNFGDGDEDERPAHTVTISGFYISKTEVTVAQYRRFCESTRRQMPPAPDWDFQDNHPMVNVTWNDARAFCTWEAGRLPTEAEWEYAARNRGKRIKFTCGNQLTPGDANYSAEDKYRNTAPVASFPTSELGLFDMVGNAWEWCNDWYDKNFYKNSPATNPTGPESGKFRVLRGGAWNSDVYFSRATSRLRLDPNSRNEYSGFRVVRDARKGI